MNPGTFYLYEYENNRRRRNVGFIKISRHYQTCIFQIHVRGISAGNGAALELYAFFRNGDSLIGSQIATLTCFGKNISVRLPISECAFPEGRSLAEMDGFLIRLPGGNTSLFWMASAFFFPVDISMLRPPASSPDEEYEESAPVPAHQEEELPPSPSSPPETEAAPPLSSEPETAQPDFIFPEPETEEPGFTPAEPETEEPGFTPVEPETEEPGFTPVEPETEEPDFVPSEPEMEEPGFASSEPETEEPSSVPEQPEGENLADMPEMSGTVPVQDNTGGTPIENNAGISPVRKASFSRTVPETSPARENSKKARKIQRSDLSILPRRFWFLANNSFLLHGYHNYNHLLLAEEKGRLWLGVPGIYDPREAKAADLFGFPQFTREYASVLNLEPDERSSSDNFGHWCRCVGAGKIE